MNRKLLVTLLHKNIEELGMITESFMEMNEYPQAIVQLAKRKTEDILIIIDELATSKNAEETTVVNEDIIISKDDKPETTDLKQDLTEPVFVPSEISNTHLESVISTQDKPDQTDPLVENFPVIEISLDEIETITQTTVEQTIEIETDFATTETVVATETVVTEEKKLTEEIKKVTIAEKMGNHSTSRNEMLSSADKSFSSSLAHKKVTDIKQAISIGDRFRFQRELFKSNGEDMNKTLTYLNQLATLDEALSFLKSKYGWEENHEAVEDFYQIVKRKFA